MLTLDSLIMGMNFVPFEERQKICALLPYKLKTEEGRQFLIQYLDILLRNYLSEDLRSKINYIKTGIILMDAMEEINE